MRTIIVKKIGENNNLRKFIDIPSSLSRNSEKLTFSNTNT